jgi:hypothetical protein
LYLVPSHVQIDLFRHLVDKVINFVKVMNQASLIFIIFVFIIGLSDQLLNISTCINKNPNHFHLFEPDLE